jgi:hypothetical protein
VIPGFCVAALSVFTRPASFASAQTAVVPSDGGWPFFYLDLQNLQPALNPMQALSAALRPFMDHMAVPGDGLPTTRASGRTRGVVPSMVHSFFMLPTNLRLHEEIRNG